MYGEKEQRAQRCLVERSTEGFPHVKLQPPPQADPAKGLTHVTLYSSPGFMLEGSLQWLQYLTSGNNCQVQRQLHSPQFWSLSLSIKGATSLSLLEGTNSCHDACYHPKAHPGLQVHLVPVAPLTLLSLLNHSSSRALLTQLLIPLQPTIFAICSLGPPSLSSSIASPAWSPLPAVSPPHPHNPWPGPVCCRYSVYYFLSLLWALREAPGCTLLQIKNNTPWSSHVLSLCICCQNP